MNYQFIQTQIFMKRMITDKDFSINKLRNINKLSQEEAYIIKVILICVAEQNNFKFKTGVDYGYDPLNSMSIQTKEDYDETIRNFVLANLIFKIVDNSPKFMKYNQYVRGQFSKESKQLIINILRENLDIEKYIEREVVKFEKTTKGMMLGERFFKNYATNISYYEVLGIEKKPKK